MGKDFVVAIKPDTERGREFQKIFHRTEFQVESFIPEMALLPGFEEPQRIFKLDLRFLTFQERNRLCVYLGIKFNIPYLEVYNSIEEEGVPILDQDCYLILHNPQRWV